MPRAKEPVALIKAKGKTHRSNEYFEQREAQELKVEYKDVVAPDYLPKQLVAEFDDIASKLLHIGIMTELDADCLARYLLSKQQYLALTTNLIKATRDNDIAQMEKLASLQDRFFKQCRASGNDLGLSITSRCKLVMPEVETIEPVNRFSKFAK